jgi:hypothetical protein
VVVVVVVVVVVEFATAAVEFVIEVVECAHWLSVVVVVVDNPVVDAIAVADIVVVDIVVAVFGFILIG